MLTSLFPRDFAGIVLRGRASAGLFVGGVSLSCIALSCSGAPPAQPVSDTSPRAAAPLARVSFSARGRRTLAITDRVALFDRVGFSSPSAIIHDAVRDVYWVSNINGDASKSKGFISKLDPEGTIITLNFIDSAQPGVTLNSPRGLAVAGEFLYVADATAVRKFRVDNGEPAGSIEIPQAVYLSDVAVAADGSLYVTDVGSDPSVASLPDTGADAIYQISPAGQVSTVAQRPELGGPFALLADGTGLWITCTGTDDLLLLIPDSNGAPAADAGRLRLPASAPRGLVAVPDGTFLISSWSGGAIYRGFKDGPFEAVISGLESPADLGYDARRKRLLVPLLSGHALAIFELPPFQRPAPEPPSASP